MNAEASFWAFIGWLIAGMGFHLGWGLISLLITILARAIGVADKSMPQ